MGAAFAAVDAPAAFIAFVPVVAVGAPVPARGPMAPVTEATAGGTFVGAVIPRPDGVAPMPTSDSTAPIAGATAPDAAVGAIIPELVVVVASAAPGPVALVAVAAGLGAVVDEEVVGGAANRTPVVEVDADGGWLDKAYCLSSSRSLWTLAR